MSTEGILAGAVILLIAIAWIGSPLLKRHSTMRNEQALRQKQRDRLLMIYERVLTNIRDLDEDRSTGKMRLSDYEAEREEWVQRGVQVLKALDALDAEAVPPPAPGDENDDQAIDEQIEEAIAAYRARANQT